MNDNKKIMKYLKPIIMIEPEDVNHEIFQENIEGETEAPNIPQGQFRMKTGTLKANGSLHIQMGHPEPSKIWKAMEKDLGTPFCATNSDRVLRKYGVAFNIPSANGSIDQHEMMELGHRLAEKSQVTSFASPATDYVVMEFVGVVDGKDNKEEDVKMMEFKIGGSEQLFIAFSHLDVLRKTANENYPTVRQECLLAWLVANFVEVIDDE